MIGNKRKLFKKTGFSETFLLIAVAFGLILVGSMGNIYTQNPRQVILDPNQNFANPTGKKTLQLRTLAFITPTNTDTPTPSVLSPAPNITASPIGPTPALCNKGGVNSEKDIVVGSSPANGQSVGSGGQIKVWVNDENPPIIAPGEQLNPTTGAITTPGIRSAKAGDGYLWEPAVYISPQTAESGGTALFPTAIKGDYDNTTQGENGPHLVSATIDSPPAGSKMKEKYTSEDIWDVNSLGLAPGTYTAEFVIHDGDDDRGINCVSIVIQ